MLGLNFINVYGAQKFLKAVIASGSSDQVSGISFAKVRERKEFYNSKIIHPLVETEDRTY